MKYLIYIVLFLSLSVFGQESIEATLIKKMPLELQDIIGIDNFGDLYSINQATFQKKVKSKTITYSNVQLGNITSANAFNPLKINLFYKNFNTAIILDNRLAEIYKIDFNSKQPYKNVSHISTGYDNTIWLFNQENQQLELYDYKANTIRATTIPVQSNVLDIKSNYNYCWLLTENGLYTYNYFGSVISKLKNEGFTKIAEDNGNLILKTETQLYYLAKETNVLIPIKLPELLINRFLLTNETLYIYDGETLHQFQLKFK
jgi:WD40 repeat protein